MATAKKEWPSELVFSVESPGKVDSFLRQKCELSWNAAREWVMRSKVWVNDIGIDDFATALKIGDRVLVRPNAPRKSRTAFPDERIVFFDSHFVVVEKPQGLSTIPYEPGEKDTLIDRVHRWMVRHAGQPAHASLGIVHRIDKETSGLVVFARTLTAKRALDQLFRSHTIERSYIAFVHGRFEHAQTIRSYLVEDRGDGLRGSVKEGGRPNHQVTEKKKPKTPTHSLDAKLAITHLAPIEPGDRVSKIGCKLETGRTHQIRIHLAESGHPLVGEKVYIRDFLRDGHKPIASPRMMLHASVLGFVHPFTQKEVRFECPLPSDFEVK